jgi:transcriptional regulator with XRE-family HTH domain
VRMLMAAQGMTTLDLGRQLGLGRSPIYDRTQGRKPFTVDEVASLAEFFDVPVSVFYAGPDALLGRHAGDRTALTGVASPLETRGRETTRSSFRSFDAFRVAA